VTPYPDPSLPQPNSVSFLDGYFLFTIGDGRIFASGVNDIWVDDSDPIQNALSFTTADQSGGLLRGTVWAQQFFAWGKKACTVYTDAGTAPFPLSRATVIQIGLAGPWAVAGFEPGWGLTQFFVAADNTVRRLDGYDPAIVSNRDVEHAIASVTDKNQLEMSCYVEAGKPTVVVSGPGFTWELNPITGYWNERQSYGSPRWRASKSVNFAGYWLYGDTRSTKILRVSGSTFDELGQSFVTRMESGPIKQYPNRIRCTAVYFDFTTGQGAIGGTPDAIDPSVSISTSLDGGGTWSTPVIRRTLGRQGEFNRMIRVNRAGGISTQHGIRFRIDESSPVYATFRGGRADVQLSGAP
jgi:hypothetical protein